MTTTISLAIVNLLLVIIVAPFYEGVIRKLKAVVHSRKGPPLRQPYLDLLKLLGKERLEVGGNPLFSFAPVLTFGSVLVAALLTPMGASPPLGFAGDLIVLVYFLALASVGIMLGGTSTGNPYGALGTAREMMLAMVVEIIVVGSLIVAVIHSHSFDLMHISSWYRESGPVLSMVIAAIPFFLVLQVQLGKLPFDIPDADQEIMGGPFIEAGGPSLALYKWSYFAKQIILASLFLEVFIPWPKTGVIPVDILINLVKVLVVIALVGVIDAVNPRIRIDQAVRYFIGIWVVLVFAIAFALIGV
ncbi:MAG: NADH-quinone oxidoreductase subunit H [Deltaproteobacteria bacterium]|nr:NADH-quinone oxidoreductase subunit H [Deltaproteobacteria bacterium]